MQRIALSLGFVLLVATGFGAMLLSGCEDEDVGIRCDSAGTQGGAGGAGLIISQALECRSRLCVFKEGVTNAVPRCTKVCEENSDCPDEGPNCTEGFVCRVGSITKLAGTRCCKLCICKDDLSASERQRDTQAETCAAEGIEPLCPNI